MAKYKSIIGKTIELTNERKNHITERHPETKSRLNKIGQVLSQPDQVRVDSTDPKVLLFYKYFSKIHKHLVVVTKTNNRNFILTFYSTYKIKTGKEYRPIK